MGDVPRGAPRKAVRWTRHASRRIGFASLRQAAHGMRRVPAVPREIARIPAHVRSAHPMQATRLEVAAVVQLAEDWNHHRRAAQHAPLLSAERERTLLRAAQGGSRCSRDELIASHMRLVVDIASRHARAGLNAHDLIGEGVVGLLEAINRFDLTRETRFSSYAIWWVRACVRRFALANRRIVGMPSTRGARIAQARLRGVERGLCQQLGRVPSRDEVAQSLGIKEDEVEAVDHALSSWDVSLSQPESADPADERPSPEMLVADAEDDTLRHHRMQEALAALSQREQQLLCERLCEDEGKSLSDMGREFGVSRQRAGQILASAREKLRHCLEQAACG